MYHYQLQISKVFNYVNQPTYSGICKQEVNKTFNFYFKEPLKHKLKYLYELSFRLGKDEYHLSFNGQILDIISTDNEKDTFSFSFSFDDITFNVEVVRYCNCIHGQKVNIYITDEFGDIIKKIDVRNIQITRIE